MKTKPTDEARSLALKLFTESFERYQIERFARSWFNADRLERRARLSVVMLLAIELERIKATASFATALGDGMIEDVIEGDWRRVEDAASDFEFRDESEELRARYAPLWASFVMIARAACVQARERTAGQTERRN